jgi:hypothetical protein
MAEAEVADVMEDGAGGVEESARLTPGDRPVMTMAAMAALNASGRNPDGKDIFSPGSRHR